MLCRVDENDPLDFCNSIANDGEEFLDERNSTEFEGENISSYETFVEPKNFDDDQNKPCPKSSSKKESSSKPSQSIVVKEWVRLLKGIWEENCTVAPQSFHQTIQMQAIRSGRETFTGFGQNDCTEFIEFFEASLNIMDP